jgi:hypothetical protein
MVDNIIAVPAAGARNFAVQDIPGNEVGVNIPCAWNLFEPMI